MRKLLVVSVVVLITAVAMSATLGVMAGKEFGGRDRYYLGAQATLGGALGLGIDVYYPISSFESAAEELSNAQIVEVDPGLFLSLKFSDTKIYAFVSPMIALNIQTMEYQMKPIDTLRGKLGVRFKAGIFSIFIEGITAFQYSPFATSGIYGAQGGISLGF